MINRYMQKCSTSPTIRKMIVSMSTNAYQKYVQEYSW